MHIDGNQKAKLKRALDAARLAIMVLDAKIARGPRGEYIGTDHEGKLYIQTTHPQAAPTWEPYALDPVPPDVRAEVEFHSRQLMAAIAEAEAAYTRAIC